MGRRTIRKPVYVAPLPVEQQVYNLGVRAGEARRNRDNGMYDQLNRSFRYLYTSYPDRKVELQNQYDQGNRDGFGQDCLKVSGL